MLIENEPYWFPMRIRNSSLSRLEQMVEHFDKEKKHLGQSVLLETYVPLNFIKVSMTKMDFAPYLLNYIFVHSTFKDLVEIKHSREDFEPLRFVMHPAYDEKYERHDEVLTMSDKMMSDYMRITAEENEKLLKTAGKEFLDNPSIKRMLEQKEAAKRQEIGKKYTDFELPDKDGKMHKLSDKTNNH